MIVGVILTLSCHSANAAACKAMEVDAVRFTSSVNFTASEEHYTLADIVRVDKDAQTLAKQWIRGKTLKIEPSYKAEPDRYNRCSVVLRNADNGHSLQYAYVREGLALGYNEKGYGLATALLLSLIHI